MEYDSKSLFTIAAGETKLFNLLLPEEFNLISGKDGGSDLKRAITASYKLPGETDYTDFTPEDITTEYERKVGLKLSATSLINIGETTKFKIQIDNGKILDSLVQKRSFVYKKIISESKVGGYTFKGMLTDEGWMPEGGLTDKGEAANSDTKP